jgi:hypothetical protein
MSDERPDEIALTAEEWLMRRQKEVSLRAVRRVFIRVTAQRLPGAKKYRDEWDKAFEEFRNAAA